MEFAYLWWLLGLAGAVTAAVFAWWILGRGPRRRRLYRRIQDLLQQHNWIDAQQAIARLRECGTLSPAWEGRVRNAEGECLRLAGESALADKHYEKALERLVASAQFLQTSEAAAREHVVAAMLAEVRRLFAITTGPQTVEVRQLIDRVLAIQSPGPEASFWQGLCHVREGKVDAALASLRTAHEHAGKTVVDPALYLGALLRQQGRLPEALRLLAEAHRLEPNCPWVSWQLGLALVAAGGDAPLAARALQRALGSGGLPMWVKEPHRAWVEGFPDPARSYVPRLASQHPFVCPVLGSDLSAMIRQGMLALSQAQYRIGNYQESANLCETLLKEAPPTLPVLRGLGLALARLERYDEAFKHLRTAYEIEQPKDPLTTGYLALCGARGKPKTADDRPKNVAWAVRLVSGFHEALQAKAGSSSGPSTQLQEWAGLCSAILAEARLAAVPVPAVDLERCCDFLALGDAVDPAAAAAYDQLAAASLDRVGPRHAFLWCRAAQQHRVRGHAELSLFAITFRNRSVADSFYNERGWDLGEVEYTYLERWAEVHPGSFPSELGSDYPQRAESLLLARASAREQAGQTEDALASVDLLLRLIPHSATAHDRLAALHYRQGNLDRAAELLAGWQTLDPANHLPSLRLALLEHQRRGIAARRGAINRVLGLTRGKERAAAAYLAARLVLADLMSREDVPGSPAMATLRPDADFAPLFGYLADCLESQPDHPGALALLAAVRWLVGDRAGLAEQSRYMQPTERSSSTFHYLAGVCHLAAGDLPAAIEAARRAADDPELTVESQFLAGLAHLQDGRAEDAVPPLQQVALSRRSPSADHARALLGRQAFAQGHYLDASSWFSMVDPARRTAWKLDDAHRGSFYLAGLRSLSCSRFEQAADQFRQAGKLGWRDRNLGPLLALALFKEGQRAFSNAERETQAAEDNSSDLLPVDLPPPTLSPERWSRAATFLDQAHKIGIKDANALYLLAMACKRRGQFDKAREVLRKIAPADSDVWLQLGLLSLQQRQLAQAEEEFARAWEMAPSSFAAGANLLLTRLALGRPADALPLGQSVVALAPNTQDWYLFTLLHALVRTGNDGNGAPVDPVLTQMTADDERRLVGVLRGLGHLETTAQLLGKLAAGRLDSPLPRHAYFEVQLLAGKRLLDRCDWPAAERHLTGLTAGRDAPPHLQTAFLNLLGCALCLCQDFDAGIRHFQAALRLAPTDLAVHQNLAVAHEWQHQLDRAEMHWNRFFDLVERRRTTGDCQDFWTRLCYEGYLRLGALYSEKDRGPLAVSYLERAQRLRPDHVETLERLFHMYQQIRRPDQARRVLQQLQQLRPQEPQFELYELELIEVNELDDLERWLAEVSRILQRHSNDPRVEERSAAMLGNAVSFMSQLSDQLTEQLNKVMKQVRTLDNYQINWSAVHDVMRDLKREFQKLRGLAAKCHTMASSAEHRRILRDLADHLDRKIDYCRRWQGD